MAMPTKPVAITELTFSVSLQFAGEMSDDFPIDEKFQALLNDSRLDGKLSDFKTKDGVVCLESESEMVAAVDFLLYVGQDQISAKFNELRDKVDVGTLKSAFAFVQSVRDLKVIMKVFEDYAQIEVPATKMSLAFDI